MEKLVMKAAEQPMAVPKDYVDLLLVQRMSDDLRMAATVPFGEAQVDDIVNVDGELCLVLDKIPILDTDDQIIAFVKKIYEPVTIGSVYAVFHLSWSKGDNNA